MRAVTGQERFVDDGFGSGGERDISGPAKRSEPRDSMFLQAQVTRARRPTVSVRVRNLSAGGMMGESDQLFVVGEAVTVELRTIGTVDARVAWIRPGQVGIAFDEPVDPRQARKAPAQSVVTGLMTRPSAADAKRPKLREG
jgi:hypothetical protein